jgi:hypothetical protein
MKFSSKGRATRIFGIKTGRIHQLHSDNQYRAFLTFEFCEKTLDIRESYPLLDVMEVIDEKENLRFDKFRDKETKEPFIITTNFLLTVKEGRNEKLMARTVKNTSELNRRITFEKLEIERRYWSQKGIDWKVITEKQLPRQLAKNIEWVRETVLASDEGKLEKEKLSLILFGFLLENDELPLKEVLRLFDNKEGLQKGSGLFFFRYLIAKKEIRINMSQIIDFSSSIRNLILTPFVCYNSLRS